MALLCAAGILDSRASEIDCNSLSLNDAPQTGWEDTTRFRLVGHSQPLEYSQSLIYFQLLVNLKLLKDCFQLY